MTLIPFGRYVRLHMLHRVETAAEVLIVRMRIETLRYSLLPLHDQPVDAAYADDPHAGARIVREAVLPRLETLLDAPDPWALLDGLPAREMVWHQYAAERGLPPGPVPVTSITVPPVRRVQARTPLSTRLAQAQRALELLRTGIETASALATLWQNWQIGREKVKLLAAQRAALHGVIEGQLVAQDNALTQGLDAGYVRRYLADHGDDEGYRAVFDE